MSDPPGAPPSPIDGHWDHSERPAISTVRGDVFPGGQGGAPSPGAETDPIERDLAAIGARDRGFSRQEFLQQVQGVFFRVEQAWSEHKPEISRQVMADGLWQQHRSQMDGYVAQHRRNVLDGLELLSVTVISVETDATYDTIVVRILASCADYDVDEDSGRVVRGNRDVEQWMEDWTFQRAVGARTPPAGGTLSAKCPNCGAPIDLDHEGVCRYCKAPVSSGTYDWVLTRISQVPPAY